jgi:hypothetical protein
MSDTIVEVADNDLYDRLFTFSVKQTNEEEESATPREGFEVCLYASITISLNII